MLEIHCQTEIFACLTFSRIKAWLIMRFKYKANVIIFLISNSCMQTTRTLWTLHGIIVTCGHKSLIKPEPLTVLMSQFLFLKESAKSILVSTLRLVHVALIDNGHSLFRPLHIGPKGGRKSNGNLSFCSCRLFDWLNWFLWCARTHHCWLIIIRLFGRLTSIFFEISYS